MQQALERLARFAPGPRLKVFAQPDEGDQHGRSLEKNRAVGAQQPEVGRQRVEIGRGSAQRHQHVHVGRAIFERAPGAAVEDQAGRELQRGGQQQIQLHHGPIGVHAHGQHDRQGGNQRYDQPVALRAQRIIHGGFGFAQLDRRVTGGMDNRKDIGLGQLLRIKTDKTGFGGQIDDGGSNGWVFQQFAFQGVYARGAVQAAHTECKLPGRFGTSDAVTQLFHSPCDLIPGYDGFIKADSQLFGGKVDNRAPHSFQQLDLFFDSCGTIGAGHAGN